MVETHKPTFIEQVKSYPRQFWVANTMEIFERLSWYGWFTVMALYVTGSVETGGLGFTTETRGALQAIVPFFLYLLPVFTGAMADRYGYKRSFVISYIVMIIAYYLLGQFSTLPTFFLAFLFVAVGAGIFKPVVTGTVAKVTDESNSALGFGIFYMMVNIGGFLGPIVAGVVRGWGWEYVFIACSAWAGVNLIIVLTLYKEPEASDAQRKGNIRQVLDNMVEVLGNFRFFLTVFMVLFLLMFANLRVGPFLSFTWTHAAIAIPAWLLLNFGWDRVLPADSGKAKPGEKRSPLARRMYCSNWRFAVFLLIMSGFWTSFNQIFYTMPEYIRDFTETRPMIGAAEGIFGESDATDPDKGVASAVATVNPKEKAKIKGLVGPLARVLAPGDSAAKELKAWAGLFDKAAAHQGPEKAESEVLAEVSAAYAAAGLSAPDPATAKGVRDLTAVLGHVPEPAWTTDKAKSLISNLAGVGSVDSLDEMGKEALRKALIGTSFALLDTKLRILPSDLGRKAAEIGDADKLTSAVIISSRQFNPEFIVNINAFSIILFQMFVSFLMARFHQFTTMIVGMVVAAVGIGFACVAGTEGVVGLGASAWIVAAALLIFSFGEMMASPTSQEYVGRIAPGDKKALYMGYYFVAIALGNLFGGILSGELYGHFARDMQRPDIMWMIFGGLMLGTAVVFIAYNKLAMPKGGMAGMTVAAEDAS